MVLRGLVTPTGTLAAARGWVMEALGALEALEAFSGVDLVFIVTIEC